MTELPDFYEASILSAGLLASDELSECHGLACGLLCGQANTQYSDYLSTLLAGKLIEEPDTTIDQLLHELLDASRLQLADENMRFELWLPQDTERLQDRARALGSWCSGYLTGLVEVCGPQLEQVSADVREVISDMSQIARVSLDEEEDEESEETAFTEILEFVRIAVLLVREELSGPGQRDRIH